MKLGSALPIAVSLSSVAVHDLDQAGDLTVRPLRTRRRFGDRCGDEGRADLTGLPFSGARQVGRIRRTTMCRGTIRLHRTHACQAAWTAPLAFPHRAGQHDLRAFRGPAQAPATVGPISQLVGLLWRIMLGVCEDSSPYWHDGYRAGTRSVASSRQYSDEELAGLRSVPKRVTNPGAHWKEKPGHRQRNFKACDQQDGESAFRLLFSSHPPTQLQSMRPARRVGSLLDLPTTESS